MSRQFTTAILSASFSVFTAAFGTAAPVAPAAASHVRPTDSRLQGALQAGLAKSPTFRALVQILDDSDVVVYPSLELTRPGLRGYLLQQLTVAGPNRYVRLVLSVRLNDAELVAVLAHELQHAVEVAEAIQVRSTPQLRLFFEQAGVPTGLSRVRETEAALRVQERVRRELRQDGQTLARGGL